MQKAPVRSAAMYIIRTVMRGDKDVKGCEVIISGKLRQQRAKVMKYKGGYLISTGKPKDHYIDHAIRYISFPQGVIGLQVKIMLPANFMGKNGIIPPLPDKITIHEPKEDYEKDMIPEQ